MTSAWLLPEHIADVLPTQARRLETLRRRLLDCAEVYGYELVMPPLLEHLESLLTGTGRDLDLQTFKLVDQMSGRSLGLRADTTPQAARIDAHLLNHEGVTRLCYCGPVLHTRAAGLQSSREPLQFGAELFGHAGLEADLEAQELALDCLARAGHRDLVIDLADARVLRGVLAGVPATAERLQDIATCLAGKDSAGLKAHTAGLPDETRQALDRLIELYGDDEVLSAATDALPDRGLVRTALKDLAWLAAHLRTAYPGLKVGFDLSDMGGYGYYSGPRFAVYGRGSTDALARGGRYDEVGAIFGRNRPAVGFSLDLKALVQTLAPAEPIGAIRAPWSEDPALRSVIRRLRDEGRVVMAVLPGHESEALSFRFDHELVHDVHAGWSLRVLQIPSLSS